jgi:fumarate reductase subunit C
MTLLNCNSCNIMHILEFQKRRKNEAHTQSYFYRLFMLQEVTESCICLFVVYLTTLFQ